MIDTPWNQSSKEASFLQSMMAAKNQFHTTEGFHQWFEEYKTSHHYVIEEIPLSASPDWYFADSPYRLVHRSGKFFSIEGIRTQTNLASVASAWDQPIINQPEIGILGIITKVIKGVRYFLMQAKMEPGNVNLVQLSPTVQATRSNYTRIHQGKTPPYLEYFIEPRRARILLDQLQSEQGARFLQKRNRNMIVEVDESVPLHEGYCWLTLREIKQLLQIDNFVNMDSRTVLACISFVSWEWQFYYKAMPEEPPFVHVFGHQLSHFSKRLFLSMLDRYHAQHSLDDLINWFTQLKSHSSISIEKVGLNQLNRWALTDWDMHHESKRHFSVIMVSVQAASREVSSWTQPLLKHQGHGIVGFLTKPINNVLHFLVHAMLEPGNRDLLEMGPTVSNSDPDRYAPGQFPPFFDYFLHPNPDYVRYSKIQSEEGGRFYHFQNRYMILELPEEAQLEVPGTFIWMTLAQIVEFMKYGYFNIEARNLIACLYLEADTADREDG